MESGKSTWLESAKLVTAELKRLDGQHKEHETRIRNLEIKIAVLCKEIKAKTLVWGSLGALIPILITIGIGLLFMLLKSGNP